MGEVMAYGTVTKNKHLKHYIKDLNRGNSSIDGIPHFHPIEKHILKVFKHRKNHVYVTNFYIAVYYENTNESILTYIYRKTTNWGESK